MWRQQRPDQRPFLIRYTNPLAQGRPQKAALNRNVNLMSSLVHDNLVSDGDCADAEWDLGQAFWRENSTTKILYGLSSMLYAWKYIVLPKCYPNLLFCKAMEYLA